MNVAIIRGRRPGSSRSDSLERVSCLMGTTAPLEDSVTAIEPDRPTPAVARLLNALRAEGYLEDRFGPELQAMVESDPEAAWEFASLLDQHFRRGDIRPADYRLVNSRLINLLLGAPHGTEHRSGRSPMHATSTAAIVTTSVPGDATEIDAPAQVADGESLVGRTLRGRYRIVRVIGRGGLGTVFEAVDAFRVGEPEDRRVALKVLHPAVSGRPDMLSALVREFQHVQRLSHPNIVRVHEFDRDEGVAFFTMELLSGLTLDRLLVARRHTALDRRHALAIVRDIGAALAHAHSNGIVHGDINLHNVFVTEAGAVRVLDFGSSSKLRTEPWISDADPPERARFATRQYASCELLEGGVAEARDDLFAFACLVYVLFTRRHPFGERTAQQARTLGLSPRRPAGLARGQWRALCDGLSLRRDRRPQDVEAWTRRLLADAPLSSLPRLSVLAGVPRRESAPWFRLVAGFAALVLLAGGWWAWRASDPRFLAVTAALGSNATRLAGQTEARIVVAAHSFADGFLRFETNALAMVRRDAPVATVARTQASVAAAHSTAAAAVTGVEPSNLAVRHATRVRPTPARRPRTVAVAAIPVRIELATNRVTVSPRDPVARVVVDRFGNRRAAIRFRWTVQPGTARQNKDFVVVGPHVASIGRGQRSVDLLIPIVFDPTRHRPVSFYVTLSRAGTDALIGPRTITRVTLLPPR